MLSSTRGPISEPDSYARFSYVQGLEARLVKMEELLRKVCIY